MLIEIYYLAIKIVDLLARKSIIPGKISMLVPGLDKTLKIWHSEPVLSIMNIQRLYLK